MPQISITKLSSLQLFTISAVSVFVLTFVTTLLNLFKGNVSNTFYIAQLILIILTLVVATIGFSESKIQSHKVYRWLTYVVLILTTITGNLFTLLMFVSLFRYEHTSKYNIYNSWEAFISKIKQHKVALVSFALLTYLPTLSITGIYTFNTSLATQNQFNELLKGPSLAHPFGTDDFGRDLFTRLVVGTKLTYFISITSVVISVLFGVLFGMIAGYFTKVDNTVMRILDIIFAIPTLLLAVAIIASFGASTLTLIIALSIGNIPSFARTMRANVLEIKRQEYIQAAQITGESHRRILWSYILPNTLAPMIVRFSLNIGVVVLTTSGLSFLGLGVAPNVPEWGNILRTGSNFLETHSNLAIFPGLCIMLLVLAFNFIGDAVRDALDPKIQ
ncbi:ABC transporter permease [Staphylococcus pasteuri]|uniref:ABC transporter permease n=1 Tax=Staphylococcus pasteuri TaxID=45972 RepID=UPI001E454827|nr:ABC transporter permease [Staphylococcus pasteuri]MCD9067535.1 ABC transporter permease [Staphylococcus pasteuri]